MLRRPFAALLKNCGDFLERLALGFRHAEINEDGEDEQQRGKQCEHVGAEPFLTRQKEGGVNGRGESVGVSCVNKQDDLK